MEYIKKIYRNDFRDQNMYLQVSHIHLKGTLVHVNTYLL